MLVLISSQITLALPTLSG